MASSDSQPKSNSEQVYSISCERKIILRNKKSEFSVTLKFMSFAKAHVSYAHAMQPNFFFTAWMLGKYERNKSVLSAVTFEGALESLHRFFSLS